MIKKDSDVNPLGNMLRVFPVEWQSFSASMFQAINLCLIAGGYTMETQDEVYAVIGVLKEMELIDCEYASNGRPCKVKRLIKL